jgi:hypothetical protein
MRIPAGSDLFLHRPRLVELLNRAVGRQVTLVTGPAGAGKTLAVADGAGKGPPAARSSGCRLRARTVTRRGCGSLFWTRC